MLDKKELNILTGENHEDVNSLYTDLENLEDYIERLSLVSDISYDVNFHKEVIGKYSALIKKVTSIDIPELDKEIITAAIKQLFIEYGISNTIENNY